MGIAAVSQSLQLQWRFSMGIAAVSHGSPAAVPAGTARLPVAAWL